jgi:hypothetical protein
MAANPNWDRWMFASVAFALKEVAEDAGLAVLVEHLDERSDAFMAAADRAEIRITGPFTQEISKGHHRCWLDANVLLTSRYDGQAKNAYDILKFKGLFHERMSEPIAIWNYGNEDGDYVIDEAETQIFLGCFLPRPGRNESIRGFNFGQIDKTDKLKQSAVDGRYVVYLDE